MSASWAVVVVIPARDEAATIEACVRSVIDAGAEARQPFDITVVADRCRDATAAIARRAVAGHGRVIEIDAGIVGAGRRIGADRALGAGAAAGHPPERTWLLATDGDSTVPIGWISTHVRLASAGAQGVAGLVVVDSFEQHPTPVESMFRRRYLVGPGGEHPHVHGTNLGVRADAYRRAGGWHDVATGEDHDLWRRLQASGAPLTTTVEDPVRTSGRSVGRAPDGFAALLRSFAEGVEPDGLAG